MSTASCRPGVKWANVAAVVSAMFIFGGLLVAVVIHGRPTLTTRTVLFLVVVMVLGCVLTYLPTSGFISNIQMYRRGDTVEWTRTMGPRWLRAISSVIATILAFLLLAWVHDVVAS